MGARQRRPSGDEAEPVSPLSQHLNPIDHSGDETSALSLTAQPQKDAPRGEETLSRKTDGSSSPSDEMAPWMKSNDDDNAVDAPIECAHRDCVKIAR